MQRANFLRSMNVLGLFHLQKLGDRNAQALQTENLNGKAKIE
jgi:hypothetical protein